MTSTLETVVGRNVTVITNDGRHIVGSLRGYDQMSNLILQDSHERVYTDSGCEQHVLGLYIVKGDNVSVVGEHEPELEAQIDLKVMSADALKEIIH